MLMSAVLIRENENSLVFHIHYLFRLISRTIMAMNYNLQFKLYHNPHSINENIMSSSFGGYLWRLQHEAIQ